MKNFYLNIVTCHLFYFTLHYENNNILAKKFLLHKNYYDKTNL